MVLILTVLMFFLLSGCPLQDEAKVVSNRGNPNVKPSTTSTENHSRNAPSFEADEISGDDDEEGDDGEDGLKEEVTGTEDCLIKKGHSLECKPKRVNSIWYNNTISDKAKDSAGKVLYKSNIEYE